MTMKATSPSSPKSYTWTMFGWLSRATACASSLNRTEYSRDTSSSRWLLMMVLIATGRFSFGSSASYTTPSPSPPVRWALYRLKPLG